MIPWSASAADPKPASQPGPRMEEATAATSRGKSAVSAGGKTRPNKSADAIVVEYVLRDRSYDVCVGDERQGPIVQDQPLTVDVGGQGGMIFFWQKVFENDDLQIAFGNACSQQGGIFDDRVILAIASTGLQGLQRSTPAIRNTPLRLITHGRDGKVDSPVDHGDARPAAMANAFSNDSNETWCSGNTGAIRVATRDGFEVPGDIGLHAAPFLRQLPLGDRFSIDAKHQGRLASAAGLWCRRLPMRPIFHHRGNRNMVGDRKGGTWDGMTRRTNRVNEPGHGRQQSQTR
jgi:hypothetical protein